MSRKASDPLAPQNGLPADMELSDNRGGTNVHSGQTKIAKHNSRTDRFINETPQHTYKPVKHATGSEHLTDIPVHGEYTGHDNDAVDLLETFDGLASAPARKVTRTNRTSSEACSAFQTPQNLCEPDHPKLLNPTSEHLQESSVLPLGRCDDSEAASRSTGLSIKTSSSPISYSMPGKASSNSSQEKRRLSKFQHKASPCTENASSLEDHSAVQAHSHNILQHSSLPAPSPPLTSSLPEHSPKSISTLPSTLPGTVSEASYDINENPQAYVLMDPTEHRVLRQRDTRDNTQGRGMMTAQQQQSLHSPMSDFKTDILDGMNTSELAHLAADPNRSPSTPVSQASAYAGYTAAMCSQEALSSLSFDARAMHSKNKSVMCIPFIDPKYPLIMRNEFSVIVTSAALATVAIAEVTSCSVSGVQGEWNPLSVEGRHEVTALLRSWAGINGPKEQASANRLLVTSEKIYSVRLPDSRGMQNMLSYFESELRMLVNWYFLHSGRERLLSVASEPTNLQRQVSMLTELPFDRERSPLHAEHDRMRVTMDNNMSYVPVPGDCANKSPHVAPEVMTEVEQMIAECANRLNVSENAPQVLSEMLQLARNMYAMRGVTKAPLLLPLLYALHLRHQEHLPTLLLLACTHYMSGNLAASLWFSSLILRIDPCYVEAMSNIGTAMQVIGFWKDAESWWWQALQRMPSYWDAFENLLGVLCLPTPTGPAGLGRPAQHETALRLCIYVETHVIPLRRRIVPMESDKNSRVLIGLSAGGLSPQILSPQMPLSQLPRVQHLFYAKGNLRYVLEGQEANSANEEYQRALEVIFSRAGTEGYSVRDIILAIWVMAVFTLGGAVPGQDTTAISDKIATALGQNLRNFECVTALKQGNYTLLHPEGILGLVRDAGDRAVKVFLEVGGGALPLTLLLPHQVSLVLPMLLSHTGGVLPMFHHAVDLALRNVYQQVMQIGSTIVLAIVKLFHDATGSLSGSQKLNIRGVPVSNSLLLLLYYLSLAMQPSAATLNNMGILLSSLPVTSFVVTSNGKNMKLTGQMLAMQYYAFGLQLDPRHSHLYTNLGSLLKDIGRLNDAIKMYEKAVELNPTFDVALANLGNAIKDQGRAQESIPIYRRLVQANPHFLEGLCGLVNAQLSLCDWREVFPSKNSSGWMRDVIAFVDRQLAAGILYGRGVFQFQDTLEAWVNRIVQCLGDDRTEVRNRWTAKLRPFYERTQLSVSEGGFLLRIIQHLMRQTQRRWYHDMYTHHCVPHKSDFHARYPRITMPSCLSSPVVAAVLPFHASMYPFSARQVRLISHRTALRTTFAALSQSWLPPHVLPPPPPPSTQGGRLNIGYVSSDFNNHPLAHLMQSVFGLHDRSQFHVFCYATSPSDNSVYRHKIERESETFLDVSGLTTEQVVARLQQDHVHILVNLNEYTRGARNDIFAARPCPVQVQFLGSALGMAANWIDWFIVDPIVCPSILTASEQWQLRGRTENMTDLGADLDPEEPSDAWVYTERCIYMPDSYFVNDHAQGFRDPGTSPVREKLNDPERTWCDEEIRRWQMRDALFPHLPHDYVIFANFNQLYKIDPFVFRIWLTILQRVPKSILWLLRFPRNGEVHLRRYAAEWAGPNIASRIVFTDVASKHVHIMRGRVVDLFLDTTECNAHTTASDILWSGTPLITWPRHLHKMCTRVAASTLYAARLDKQLTVHSENEYIERAVQLASSMQYSFAERQLHDDGSYEVFPVPTPHVRSCGFLTQFGASDDLVHRSMVLSSKSVTFRRCTGELVNYRRSLFLSRDECPLFHTPQWTRYLECGLKEAWRRWEAGTDTTDTPEWQALSEVASAKRSSHIWVSQLMCM